MAVNTVSGRKKLELKRVAPLEQEQEARRSEVRWDGIGSRDCCFFFKSLTAALLFKTMCII